MDNKSKIERAMKLRDELFDIANSLAGKECGAAGVMIHEACNCILQAKEKFENKSNSIPTRLILRSCGLNTEESEFSLG